MATRGYTLAMLTVCFAIAHLDRQIIIITLEPIGREFALSDMQLGLLSGFAFVASFSIFSLPLAALAARVNRRNLIAVTIAGWSIMTVLSGITQNYAQLLLARIGVGIGEAGALPASHSIISDRYERHERATAMGVFLSGANIGIALALILGGLATQLYGWRAAMLIVGAPGLVIALIIRLTVPEPARRSDPVGPGGAQLSGKSGLRQTAGALWKNISMRLMLIGAVFSSMTSFAIIAWLPTFLLRQHDMQISTVGLYLAVAVGLGGAVGNVVAARLSDRLAARNAGWLAWCPAIALLIGKPLIIAGLLAGTKAGAMAFFIFPFMVGGAYMASTISVLHGGVRAEARPMASALLLILLNMLGAGLGPLVVGTLSDMAQPAANSLALAMIAVQAFGLAGIIAFYFAGRSLGRVAQRTAVV